MFQNLRIPDGILKPPRLLQRNPVGQFQRQERNQAGRFAEEMAAKAGNQPVTGSQELCRKESKRICEQGVTGGVQQEEHGFRFAEETLLIGIPDQNTARSNGNPVRLNKFPVAFALCRREVDAAEAVVPEQKNDGPVA